MGSARHQYSSPRHTAWKWTKYQSPCRIGRRLNQQGPRLPSIIRAEVKKMLLVEPQPARSEGENTSQSEREEHLPRRGNYRKLIRAEEIYLAHRGSLWGQVEQLGPPSDRISDVYTLPTPRRQRAAQATTIAPRWQTLWRQHGSFGGTLARIFGPRIWRGRRTPLWRTRNQRRTTAKNSTTTPMTQGFLSTRTKRSRYSDVAQYPTSSSPPASGQHPLTSLWCRSTHQQPITSMKKWRHSTSNIQLHNTINSVDERDILIIQGDWNAKVGCWCTERLERILWTLMYCCHQRARPPLTEFCQLQQHGARKRFGRHKASRCWTWHAPNGIHRNQIDSTLWYTERVPSWDQQSEDKTFPGADVGSDHDLVLLNFKTRLKKSTSQREPWLKFSLHGQT